MTNRRAPISLAQAAAGGGVVPGGPAGGDLTGFYPNPIVAQARGGVIVFNSTGFSTVVATTGTMRVGKDFALVARNSANTADTNQWVIDGADGIQIGQTTGVAQLLRQANSILDYSSGACYYDAQSLNIRGQDHAGGFVFQGTGTRYLEVVNQGADPATPTAGPRMYARAGALKGIGTGGTITTMAAADLDGFADVGGHCPCCGSDFAVEWQNPKMGSLTVCMMCLAEELGERPWIRRKKA